MDHLQTARASCLKANNRLRRREPEDAAAPLPHPVSITPSFHLPPAYDLHSVGSASETDALRRIQTFQMQLEQLPGFTLETDPSRPSKPGGTTVSLSPANSARRMSSKSLSIRLAHARFESPTGQEGPLTGPVQKLIFKSGPVQLPATGGGCANAAPVRNSPCSQEPADHLCHRHGRLGQSRWRQLRCLV